uniref:UMA domain-containing protein n=1 Tax=Syphacia muris TaxID=451379 RepID=A0A0N5AX56_9BILA
MYRSPEESCSLLAATGGQEAEQQSSQPDIIQHSASAANAVAAVDDADDTNNDHEHKKVSSREGSGSVEWSDDEDDYFEASGSGNSANNDDEEEDDDDDSNNVNQNVNRNSNDYVIHNYNVEIAAPVLPSSNSGHRRIDNDPITDRFHDSYSPLAKDVSKTASRAFTTLDHFIHSTVLETLTVQCSNINNTNYFSASQKAYFEISPKKRVY